MLFGLTVFMIAGFLNILCRFRKISVTKSAENECFCFLEDNPNYYENGLKKTIHEWKNHSWRVLKFMQMELWEVEVLIC